MDKVVSLIKAFKTMFYFNFFEPGKILFGLVKVRTSLNFEFKLFKPFDWVWRVLNPPTLCQGPHVIGPHLPYSGSSPRRLWAPQLGHCRLVPPTGRGRPPPLPSALRRTELGPHHRSTPPWWPLKSASHHHVKNFLPAPLPFSNHTRATPLLLPLPPVCDSPPEHRRSHWSWSRHLHHRPYSVTATSELSPAIWSCPSLPISSPVLWFPHPPPPATGRHRRWGTAASLALSTT
jgi:hypothetical protein